MEKKHNKTSLLIGLSVAVFLIVIVGMIVIVRSLSPERRFQKQLNLGYRYLEELNYEKAIASFESAISIDSKDPRGYEGLIDAYACTEDADGIIGIYDLACDNLDPENLNAIRQASIDGVNSIIDGYVADSDYDNALSAAKTLSHIDENASNAAVVDIVAANPAALLDALDSGNVSSEVADAKGLILIGNGRYEDAIDYFEDRIVSNSETTYSYLGLASAYLGNDDVLGALEILEKGIGTGADETVIRSAEDYIRQNSIIVSCTGTMDFWTDYSGNDIKHEFGDIVETYDENGNHIASDETRNTDYSRHSELDGNGHYIYERHNTGNNYSEYYSSYNEHGDVVSIHSVSHLSWSETDSLYDYSYEYDSEGRIITEIMDGSDSYQRVYEYDENGNVIKVAHTANGVTTYEQYTYDDKGNLIEMTDYTSNHSTYEYDERG